MKGKVENVPVLFTTDTGASRTIISTRVFHKIEESARPRLKKAGCLKGAGGKPIKELGKAEFALKLESHEVVCEAIVAEIEDDALLGYDVLMGGKKGPADILLSKGKILLDGHEIPCLQIGRNPKQRKVVMADDFCVPAQSEAVVDVYVERIEDDDADWKADFLVEPTKHFKETYNLMMASTLININHSATCKVRLMNPSLAETVLRQNAEIGYADRIEGIVSVIQEKEYTGEDENPESVRQVAERTILTNLPDTLARASEEDVPDHLKKLFKDSSENLSHEKKGYIAGLLVKYQDSFSKSEWDIGLTNITEHEINTGDAPPIKQRPRRVPLAHAEEEKKAIESMLNMGVIRESTSAWASPIVLVRKKSGAIRPCVDYRRVNALVKPDGYPLPRVQDCLDAVAGAKYFSSFDLTSGYFQIP